MLYRENGARIDLLDLRLYIYIIIDYIIYIIYILYNLYNNIYITYIYIIYIYNWSLIKP